LALGHDRTPGQRLGTCRLLHYSFALSCGGRAWTLRPAAHGHLKAVRDEAGGGADSTVVPVPPRLLDLDGTAAYLGVSPWTVRDLEAAGVLPRVRVPLPNGGELRKLLFDRSDLDRLVEAWKDAAP
jgi:hypothetical protein